jgi:hypothetical protein
MEKKVKNIFAEQISAGPADHRLRDFRNDLFAAIAKDEVLKDYPSFHFFFIFEIIYMMAAGHADPSRVIYQVSKLQDLRLTEEDIALYISRVESDYGEFVQIMEAITDMKLRDFANLGASETEAYNCLNEWIRTESF